MFYKLSQLSGKKYFKPLLLISFTLLAVGLFQLFGRNQSENTQTTEILFSGHNYSHWNDIDEIYRKLGLYQWDTIVYGGDTIYDSSQRSKDELAQIQQKTNELANQSIFVHGNHDDSVLIAQDFPRYGSKSVNNVQHIFLDTIGEGANARCEFDQEQINFLQSELKKDTEVKILYTHHAMWARSDYIDDVRPNIAESDCSSGYWKETMVPLLDGKVQLVLSGDGGDRMNFAERSQDGIRYVLSGSAKNRVVTKNDKHQSKLVSFVRIQIDGKEVKLNTIEFANSQLVDEEVLSDIPTYSVAVSQAELEDVYRRSTLHDASLKWFEKIESDESNERIQAPLDAEVRLPDRSDPVAAEISTRGKVGNHWSEFKKSWDISFTDGVTRQLKFIIPNDRLYINQLFVEELANELDSLTPHIGVARLVVNGYDFGIYLVYEDFDKAFIELADYNSDVAPSGNLFRDHIGFYPIIRDLPYVDSSKTKGNNTYQQNITEKKFTTENVNQIFDQDNTARWLALQIYTGDRHQNLDDNFRFFIDKPTGRYVMVTWDVYVRKIPQDDIFPQTLPQRVFYEKKEKHHAHQ